MTKRRERPHILGNYQGVGTGILEDQLDCVYTQFLIHHIISKFIIMLMFIFCLLVLRALFKKLFFVAVENRHSKYCCLCYYWHGSGIAAEFVRQLLKINLKIMPYFPRRKKWTGWDDLNPRPQLACILSGFYLSKGLVKKENMLFEFHLVHLFLCILRSQCLLSREVLRFS